MWSRVTPRHSRMCQNGAAHDSSPIARRRQEIHLGENIVLNVRGCVAGFAAEMLTLYVHLECTRTCLINAEHLGHKAKQYYTENASGFITLR